MWRFCSDKGHFYLPSLTIHNNRACRCIIVFYCLIGLFNLLQVEH